MSQLNVEIVRSVYDAFDSGDLEGLLDHMDDGVEVYATEGLPWSGTYSGRDGMREFIDAVETHVSLSIQTDELIDSGNSVAQIGRVVGQAYATGSHFDIREIHIWGVHERKVVSFQNYTDTQAQRRALGLHEVEPPEDEQPSDGRREPFWG